MHCSKEHIYKISLTIKLLIKFCSNFNDGILTYNFPHLIHVTMNINIKKSFSNSYDKRINFYRNVTTESYALPSNFILRSNT